MIVKKKMLKNDKKTIQRDNRLISLGKRLKNSRLKIGLSAGRVASILRITRRSIHNHELGLNEPHQETLEKYGNLYRCSWKWLQTGIEEYQQAAEIMTPSGGIEFPDSGPGQMQLPPDLGSYRATRILSSDDAVKRDLHAKLEDILNSDDVSLKEATKIVINEFVRSARKDKLLDLIGEKPRIHPSETKLKQ